MTIKIIVAGSRGFSDYKLLSDSLDSLINSHTNVEIVSGTAKGADQLGERYAISKGFSISRFPADWSRFGKSAGYIRNEEMAKYSNALVAFWDGKSSGTKHMIDLANKYELVVEIIKY